MPPTTPPAPHPTSSAVPADRTPIRVFSPAELIEALRRRRRLSIRPPSQADGLPPPWKTWLQATAAALPPAAASASDVVAVMAARPPAPRPTAEGLPGRPPPRGLWPAPWASPRPGRGGPGV